MRVKNKLIKIVLLPGFLIVLLAGCSLIPSYETEVVNGHADLSALENNSITALDGEWEFYPNYFLMPGELPGSNSLIRFTDVPSVWKETSQGMGYGSYRLNLTGLTPGQDYSFYFYEKVSAAAYYIDSQKIGRDGIPGVSKDVEKPDLVPSINSFKAKSSKAVLLIHISNFSMKDGGIWESVRFGTYETVHRYWSRRIILLSMIIGAMLIIGVSQLFLYLLNRENQAPLWLSITIGLVVIKTMITGEHILMRFLPEINQLYMIKLSTLAVTFMIPSYLMFLVQSFPGICSDKILKINILVSFIYAALIIFLTLPVVQSVYSPYLLFIIINQIYIIFIIIRAVREKRPGAQWSLLASIFVLSFALNDILYEMHVIQTAYTLDLGLLIFLMLHSFLIADQHSIAHKELKRLRNELETEVENRTEELKEERNKLEILARNDALTGLFNRNSSRDIFEREILRFRRTGTTFAVVMIDLDYFKAINDSFGHAAGDHALKELGKAIKSISRRTDYCFRWGGEEFLLLMPETNEADARIHAENLRQMIADAPIETAGQTFYLTLSYGISSIYKADEDTESIVNRADTALYRAKEEGRNKGYIYKKPKES